MHFFLPSSLLLTFGSAILFFGVHPTQYASAQSCAINATEGLRLSLAEMNEHMFNSWNQVCGPNSNCEETSAPLEVTFFKRYTSSINFYNQYTTSCTEAGMTICLVTNTQKISIVNEELSIPVSTMLIQEIDKPVCFPNSCMESQVDELNVLDKQCQLALAAGESCEFESVVTCPVDRTVEGESVNCASDNPRTFSQVQLAKQALYGVMDTQCAGLSDIIGDNNTASFCEVESKPGELSIVNDYSDFIGSSPFFRLFHSKCTENGGVACGVDFVLDYTPLSGVATSNIMSFDMRYTNYPICTPKICEGDETLAKEYVLNDVGMNLCDVGSCDFELKKLNCLADPMSVEDNGDNPDKDNAESASDVDVSVPEEEKEEEEESMAEAEAVENEDEDEDKEDSMEEAEAVENSAATSAHLNFVKFVFSAIAVGCMIG